MLSPLVPQRRHFSLLRIFPMVLPGLPTSIASSPATTLAPQTPRSKALPGPMPSSAPSIVPMGPPPVASPTALEAFRTGEADAYCHVDNRLQGRA